MAIDTSNKFKVAAHSGRVFIDIGPHRVVDLPRDDALNLAAWIVQLADPDGEHFQAVLGSVMTDHG